MSGACSPHGPTRPILDGLQQESNIANIDPRSAKIAAVGIPSASTSNSTTSSSSTKTHGIMEPVHVGSSLN